MAPIRVIIDCCEQLHSQSWFAALRDQWRGLLSLEAARGQVGLLLLGRPLFRSATAGRGSPLLTIGCVVSARPMTASETAVAYSVNDELAAIAVRKTGGNPLLTKRLLDRLGGRLDEIGSDIASFASDERRHIMQLIDDHGIAARGVIADVLDAKQPIARSALIRRHFGQATVEGAECLDDLAGSGLLEEVDDCWKLKAEFVKVVPGRLGSRRSSYGRLACTSVIRLPRGSGRDFHRGEPPTCQLRQLACRGRSDVVAVSYSQRPGR